VGVQEVLVRKRDVIFGAVVGSLALTGFGSGFMVALLHGLTGDWGYMAVYVVMMAFGGTVLFVAVKQGMEMLKPPLRSKVPGYVGQCVPVWVNDNSVCNRLDGGISGFFRLVRHRWYGRQKYGDEFHGIVREGLEVEMTSKEALIADDYQKFDESK
jgi:hypothetical protein